LPGGATVAQVDSGLVQHCVEAGTLCIGYAR
jgi:hypothetical protein